MEAEEKIFLSGKTYEQTVAINSQRFPFLIATATYDNGTFNITVTEYFKVSKSVLQTIITNTKHEDNKLTLCYFSSYTNGEAYEGADLMRELNTLYLNQENGTCYNEQNDASTTCNFSTTGISSVYRSMIEEVVWNTGGYEWNDNGIPVETAYTILKSQAFVVVQLKRFKTLILI